MSDHKQSRFQFSLRSGFIFLTAAICLWTVAVEKVDLRRDRDGFPKVEVRTRVRWHVRLYRFHLSIADLDTGEHREGSCWVLRLYNYPTNCTIVFDNSRGHWSEIARRSEVPIVSSQELEKMTKALNREIRLFEGPFLIIMAVILLAISFIPFFAWLGEIDHLRPNVARRCLFAMISIGTASAFCVTFVSTIVCASIFVVDVCTILKGG
ncbi:MAG: hypothetical protein ACO1RA_02400 [Planctomycetaceae bacterium]